MQLIKRYFITGLLVWVPLAITVWVLNLLIGTMDQTLHLLPEKWHPQRWLGMDLPGIGMLLSLLIVLTTGIFATNMFGRKMIRLWETLLGHIPVVKSIYHGVKQVSDTLFSSSGEAFRKAVLVRFPHSQSWTVAFQTGQPGGEVAERLFGEHISVYVPTTPNPTSGYFLIVPRADVIELDMTVDEALKYVISMGVVVPPPPRSRSL